MGITTVGRVLVNATIENLNDLIGQIPLEALDFIVDPIHQRLLGNPDHGGEHMIDLF